jgi:hypothetical protein
MPQDAHAAGLLQQWLSLDSQKDFAARSHVFRGSRRFLNLLQRISRRDGDHEIDVSSQAGPHADTYVVGRAS